MEAVKKFKVNEEVEIEFYEPGGELEFFKLLLLESSSNISAFIHDKFVSLTQIVNEIRSENIPQVFIDERGCVIEQNDLCLAPLLSIRDVSRSFANNASPPKFIAGRDADFQTIQKRSSSLFHSKSIVMFFGGSDNHGITPRFLQSLATLRNSSELFKEYSVSVICGFAMKLEQRLKVHELSEILGFRVINSPDSILDYFSEADLSFTSGGIASRESISCLCPTVVLGGEDYEVIVGTEIETEGLGCCIGHIDAWEANYDLLAKIINTKYRLFDCGEFHDDGLPAGIKEIKKFLGIERECL